MARVVVALVLLVSVLLGTATLASAQQAPVVNAPVRLDVTLAEDQIFTERWTSQHSTTLTVNATCPAPSAYTRPVVLEYQVLGGAPWAQASIEGLEGEVYSEEVVFPESCLTQDVTIGLGHVIQGAARTNDRRLYDKAVFHISVNEQGQDPVLVNYTVIAGWSGNIHLTVEPSLVELEGGGRVIRITATNQGNGALLATPAMWHSSQAITQGTAVRLPSPHDTGELNQAVIDVLYTPTTGTETFQVGFVGAPVEDPSRQVTEAQIYVEVDADSGYVRNLEEDNYLPALGVGPVVALLALVVFAVARRRL